MQNLVRFEIILTQIQCKNRTYFQVFVVFLTASITASPLPWETSANDDFHIVKVYIFYMKIRFFKFTFCQRDACDPCYCDCGYGVVECSSCGYDSYDNHDEQHYYYEDYHNPAYETDRYTNQQSGDSNQQSEDCPECGFIKDLSEVLYKGYKGYLESVFEQQK